MVSSFPFLIVAVWFVLVSASDAAAVSPFRLQEKDMTLISAAAEGLRLRDEQKITAALDNAVKQQNAVTAAEIRLIHANYFFFTVQNRRALEEYEQVAQAAAETGDEILSALARIGQADVHFRSSDYKRVTEMIAKAEPVFRRNAFDEGLGHVSRLRGHMPFYAGDYEASLRYFAEALKHYEKAGYAFGLGSVHKYLGDIQIERGENEQALAEYDRAERYFRTPEDAFGLGWVFWARGVFHQNVGNFEKALQLFDQAHAFFVSAKYPLGVGNALKSEADIYRFAGDAERALEYYEKAKHYYEAAESTIGLANVALRKGTVYADAAGYQEALMLYREAARLFTLADSRFGLANVLFSRGRLFLHQRDTVQAGKMFSEALVLYQAMRYQQGIADVAYFQGVLSAQTGNLDDALLAYDRSIALYKKIGDIESQAHAVFGKASAAARAGAQEAAELYEASISLFERVRRQAGLSDMKKSFMDKIYPRYEEAALFMLNAGRKDQAFRLAEGMKARVFLDQLAEGLVDLEKGIDPDLKQKRDVLASRIQSLQKRSAAEDAKPVPDAKRSALLEAEIRQAENELAEIGRQIRLRNPLYASVQYPEPITLETLQQAVLKKDEVMLEYFFSKTGVYCFVIASGLFEIVQLPVPPELLEKTIRAVIASVSEVRPYHDESLALFRMLIQPVEKHLRGRTVIIIPDGPIALLPFEMLLSGDGDSARHMLEEYRIKYVQSASVLGMLRIQYRKEQVGTGFIGFGDPVYDYDNYQKKRREKGMRAVQPLVSRLRDVAGSGILGRLEGSGQEVLAIADIFANQGGARTANLRLSAREEHAKSADMEKYGYIHFAAHGILADRFQGIALSQIPDAPEDGVLTIGEIMNSRYRARLVVLSACNSGLGTMERGEGITGLSRAVMYAGSPAVVVSLWSVDDRGTRELMSLFYRFLIAERFPPEEALRRAKAGMMKHAQAEYAHPFFWAAFVLYGE